MIKNDKSNFVEREIEIPKELTRVILKMSPEIKEILIGGYEVTRKYNPANFEPEYDYLVKVNLTFKEGYGCQGDRKYYESLLEGYFKMTYGSEMNFIQFQVFSLVTPIMKTN